MRDCLFCDRQCGACRWPIDGGWEHHTRRFDGGVLTCTGFRWSPMGRPRLLDLYCGAGGAAAGYHQAGFDVVGVDVRPMPRYPFEFHQADALSVLRGMRDWPTFNGEMWRPGYFAAIHASPPCQAHSVLSRMHDVSHPDLLTPTRALLTQVGLPWVIENVPGAPMRPDIVLCGDMFGLGVQRHRWFEFSTPPAVLVPPCVHADPPVGVYGHPGGSSVRDRRPRGSLDQWRRAMGIDWMTARELAQAIPPAYTRFIGEQLLAHLGVAADA